jgi:hypothetical protein
MYKDERAQLMAFVSFVQKTGLSASLRHHDWAAFAKGYNGAGYASNGYDVKMAAAFAKYEAKPVEAVTPPTLTESPLQRILKAIFSLLKR